MARYFRVGLLVIAACVGLTGNLLAFSVGEIELQSAANEPFRAEVPFVLESHERDRELEVLLGTPQEYQLEELERPAVLEHLHLIPSPDKQDTVRIFSNVPITEKTFDLLVLMRSGKLTIVRNYHIELPETPIPAAQQVAVVEPVSRQVAADPVATAEPAIPSRPPAPTHEADLSPTPPVEAQFDSPNRYGPILRGETMYNLVSTLGVPGDQRWQAVVLLWRLNHRAFLRGNLHGLRVGAYLEVPEDFEERLNTMKMQASRQLIHNQWEAWRRRQVTTTAQAFAMTTELIEDEEAVADSLPQPVEEPWIAQADVPPEEPAADDSPGAVAPPEPPAATAEAEAILPDEEPAPDDGTSAMAIPLPPAVPGTAEAIPPSEEPVPDDSTAAVAPPQVVRLSTDEGSSFVSTQELKLLLGNLEDRLLRRLTPAQAPQGATPVVSPTELQVSLQELENRLTQRVERMMARGGAQSLPEPTAQPSPTRMPPAGLGLIAGIPMPPVAYLLILINVVLLVFALTLGWRWWRQNARGEA
jgi:Tfp pilus assembly protein FimV